MTKIDIFSGFLGAGKTTLIKKLISEAYKGEKLVLIENEFGEIGIDGGFLAESGIQINEMNSGCICCSLVGDFSEALRKVIREYSPDRILIEPSGVGKLSDVIRAVENASLEGAVLGGFTTVVDAGKCKMYMKNFGEFFNDQVENAGCIVLSHTDVTSEKKISECVALLREHNEKAVIVTTPWGQLSGEQLLEATERKDTLDADIKALEKEHHHHHEHHHNGECCHHEHEHHHDGECCHHEHEHHYDEHGNCSCGHHHGDHHHHHADEVFTSWGQETAKKFNAEALKSALEALEDSDKYGTVLRAKGIVAADDGRWLHFDYVPGEPDIRYGAAGVIGRLCVIGAKIDTSAIAVLFGVEDK